MDKNAIKRILNKDMKEIQKQNLNSLGIYIDFNEENILEAKAMIVGPKDSLYEGGFLFFNIQFPKNYPYAPPDVTYVPRNSVRIHPNIYATSGTGGMGKVCLSILGTWSGPKWTSIMDISTVLLIIQSLLDNNPLHHEPGQENNKTKQNDLYNEVIKYESINTLLIKNIIQPMEPFHMFHKNMNQELKNYNESILQFLNENKDKERKNIQVGLYRINVILDYHKLHNLYKNYICKLLEI
jgi:ubiquitin-protein ligase